MKNKNKYKEDADHFLKIILICITAFLGFLCASHIFLSFRFVFSIKKDCTVVNISQYELIDIGLLITILALAFAIAIATPYFISKKTMKSVVKDFLDKDYKPNILHRAEEVIKIDAHLSRMIAFDLMEKNYHYWAIGWSFRSLKRYNELYSDYKNYKHIYSEFNNFVFDQIVFKALDNSVDIEDTAEITFKGTDEAFRIKLRAIKDLIDFLYEEKNNETIESEKLTDISEKMQKVFISLFFDVLEKNEEIPVKELHKKIDEEIFKISRFKSEKNMLRHVFYEFVKDIEVHDNSEILKKYITSAKNKYSDLK